MGKYRLKKPQQAVLRGTAVITWGLAVSAAVADVRWKLFCCALGAALVASLAAIEAAMVGPRLDRAFTSMATAFIRPQEDPEEPENPDPPGVVRLSVAGRGRARP